MKLAMFFLVVYLISEYFIGVEYSLKGWSMKSRTPILDAVGRWLE